VDPQWHFHINHAVSGAPVANLRTGEWLPVVEKANTNSKPREKNPHVTLHHTGWVSFEWFINVCLCLLMMG